MFRSRRDAEITLGIYKRVPVLVKEGDPDANPWGVTFMRMFDMSNDSDLFYTREELEADGWHLDGNVFIYGKKRMLPLYEAKMLHHYDHRWGTYDGTEIRDVTLEEKQDPNFVVLPRYWVDEREANERLPGPVDGHLLGFRDICRSTDERTALFGLFPESAVGNNLPLMLTKSNAPKAHLTACLSSLIFDFSARLKVGGTHMNFFILMQLPVLPPQSFENAAPWDFLTNAGTWLSARSLELTFISFDMRGLAENVHYTGAPYLMDPNRRVLLRAELDAAFFHLYRVSREDTDYILDTFPIVRRKDEAKYGEYRIKRLILEVYDRMAEAIRSGEPYQTILDPPPGQGHRHPAKRGADEI